MKSVVVHQIMGLSLGIRSGSVAKTLLPSIFVALDTGSAVGLKSVHVLKNQHSSVRIHHKDTISFSVNLLTTSWKT
jgi:hypothetical protein